MSSASTVDRLKFGDLISDFVASREGSEAHALIERLYPICRSITGNGVRRSLELLKSTVPLQVHEVASGTPVFDWTVPNEWNIRDAYIKNSAGERVIDFRKNNLHVLNYSVPVRRSMSLAELRPHLFTLPDKPDWIPYRTSYYKEAWGFCLTQRQLDQLEDGEYEVLIDSSLEAGSLTYGEYRIQGETDDEVLLSSHICHPSLANDNLSGVATAARLAHLLNSLDLRYSYRFIWIPGTIGAITWLALNQEILSRIKHGLVLTCLGDSGRFTYKRSRLGIAEIDRAVKHVLRHGDSEFEVIDFSPLGYDERQFCSAGINLPMGCFMRTPNGKYPEYHTSADNLDFVTPQALGQSLLNLLRIVETLESNVTYRNQLPKCEPQLGRRGLYRQIGGTDSSHFEEAMLWLLNFSDGDHSLLDIAETSKLQIAELSNVAELLVQHDLLRPRYWLNGKARWQNQQTVVR